MIFELLFTIIFALLSLLTFYLPGYGQTPLQLPWGIDSLFQQMSSYFHAAINTLPYLQTTLTVFLYALLFELALLIFKIILGSRTPAHIN